MNRAVASPNSLSHPSPESISTFATAENNFSSCCDTLRCFGVCDFHSERQSSGCGVICMNPAIKHQTHSWVSPSLVSLHFTPLSCTDFEKWIIWNLETWPFSHWLGASKRKRILIQSAVPCWSGSLFLESVSRILKPVSGITAVQQQQQELSSFQFAVYMSTQLAQRGDLKRLQMGKWGTLYCSFKKQSLPQISAFLSLDKERPYFNPYLDKIAGLLPRLVSCSKVAKDVVLPLVFISRERSFWKWVWDIQMRVFLF